jgi:GPH family glycoside/pentoside/hexuronide:cation symporter
MQGTVDPYAAAAPTGTGRLPRWMKLAYGAGAAGWVLVDRVVITWLYYFYITAPVDGADALMLPVTFGLVMLVGRLVDALSDPVVARLSDNHQGRLGRRMPFMLGSAVPYVAVFVALFYPPVAQQSGWNALWLAVFLGLYFILFTAYVGPYLALLADLSRTTRDRIDLSTAKAVFTLVGAAVGLVGSGALIAAVGLRGMVWVLGVVGLVLLLVPAVIRERRFATAQPATLPLVEAVRTTLRNRPFVIALAGTNAFWFGFNIVTLNVALYVTSLLGLAKETVALLMAAAFGVALVLLPLVNVLCKRHGLRLMMIASLVAFAVCFLLIYLFPAPPLGLGHLTFGLVVMALAGVPLAVFFIVPDAIIATVSDLEGELSGQHREAMYFGVNGLILKVNLGLSTVVSAVLLQWLGDPLGIQLTGPVAAALVLVGAVVFTRYPEREIDRIRRDRLGLERDSAATA